MYKETQEGQRYRVASIVNELNYTSGLNPVKTQVLFNGQTSVFESPVVFTGFKPIIPISYSLFGAYIPFANPNPITLFTPWYRYVITGGTQSVSSSLFNRMNRTFLINNNSIEDSYSSIDSDIVYSINDFVDPQKLNSIQFGFSLENVTSPSLFDNVIIMPAGSTVQAVQCFQYLELIP